jgi:hypothetical protein
MYILELTPPPAKPLLTSAPKSSTLHDAPPYCAAERLHHCLKRMKPQKANEGRTGMVATTGSRGS